MQYFLQENYYKKISKFDNKESKIAIEQVIMSIQLTK